MPFEKMMDQNQPEIDRSASIWRYMDLPKLASMLSTNALYFCQIPLLGDPYEGSLLPSTIEGVRELQPTIARDYPQFLRTPQQHTNNVMAVRAYTYVSCWHCNEYESAAMWAQYAKDGFGVAVKSNLGRFIDSFDSVDEKVWIGNILYYDYRTANPPNNSIWTPMYSKRKSFEHEREIRAVVMDFDRMTELRGAWAYEPNPVPGRPVSANLNTLIERFYLAPGAPKWFCDTIKAVIAALGYGHVLIDQSEIFDEPTYF